MTPASRPQVIVVGAINVDHVFEVDRLPVAGGGVSASEQRDGFGGKGGNAATAAARLGGAVRLLGRVGRDAAAQHALADLRAEGVDVSGVTKDETSRTGQAIVLVEPGGQNVIVVSRGANGLLSPDDVESAVAATPAPGACLVSLEVAPDAVLAAATSARRAGLALIVDPAPPERLPEGVLDLGPILLPNEGEAATLTGDECPQVAAEGLYSATRAPVVVTRGSAGALLYDGDGVESVPAPSVLARDSTGAGDVLAGTLAVAIAEGQTAREALPLAVAASALSVTSPGARTGPDRASALALAATLGQAGDEG